MSVVLVCGSRSWALPERIVHRFALLPSGTVIRHGGARGADQQADHAAKMLGFEVEVFRPDYAHHGRRAPLLRNVRMLVTDPRPVLVIAFDAGTNGTGQTIDEARRRGINVEVHRP